MCDSVKAVTGGAMRRKSLAQFQSGFYMFVLFSLPKMITRPEGEISASFFASKLTLNYRLSGSVAIHCLNKKNFTFFVAILRKVKDSVSSVIPYYKKSCRIS